MDEQRNLSFWIKRAQESWVALVALITSAATLIIAVRGEPSLYTLLIATAVLSVLATTCAYIAFSKTKPLIQGGKGIYRFEHYRGAALTGIGIILGILTAFISIRSNRAFILSAFSGDTSFAWSDASREPVCDQISITPEVKRLSMVAPVAADSYAGVNYEFKAPTSTGIQVLFHKAQHFIDDGGQEVGVVMGKHFTHEGVYIPAGKSILLSDGVLLGKYDVEAAQKYNTALITQRLTFSVVSDQGLYCETMTEIEVEMTGLLP